VVQQIHSLLRGDMEPEDVAINAQSADSPWLDALEDELFSPPARRVSAKERETIRREHAGFRLVRRLSADDPRRIAGWLLGRFVVTGDESPRVHRLLETFNVFDPIDSGRPMVTH